MAVAVYRLATGNSFRTIAKSFGIGQSTAVTLTHQFCQAMAQISDEYIVFPVTSVEVGEAIEKFHSDYNCEIPQVVGAIDGTLIEIIAPNVDDKISWYARNKRYCVNNQAVVGANTMFLHVATGFCGSIHGGGGRGRIFAKNQVEASTEKKHHSYKK